MDTERFRVTLTGRSPLLMSHNNIIARDAISKAGKTGGKAGDDRYPADTWKSRLYIHGGKLVMPAENIMAGLGRVGWQISIGGKKTLKQSSQNMQFDDYGLKFTFGGKELTEAQVDSIKGDFDAQSAAAQKIGLGLFQLFVKPVSVNGKSHVRVRPKFDEWVASGEFETFDENLTLERLQRLFGMAGLIAGLGDWRPGSPKRPGPFGRFAAKVEKL